MASERLVPAVVPRKSLHPLHAPYSPVAACPVIRLMAGWSQEARTSLVLTTICINDEFSKGSLSFVSRMLTYWPARQDDAWVGGSVMNRQGINWIAILRFCARNKTPVIRINEPQWKRSGTVKARSFGSYSSLILEPRGVSTIMRNCRLSP